VHSRLRLRWAYPRDNPLIGCHRVALRAPLAAAREQAPIRHSTRPAESWSYPWSLMVSEDQECIRLLERRFDKLRHVKTLIQILWARLHGEALLRAQRPELEPLMAELCEIAAGRDDIRVECAGTIAGSCWLHRH
jgi:hypothetical protein